MTASNVLPLGANDDREEGVVDVRIVGVPGGRAMIAKIMSSMSAPWGLTMFAEGGRAHHDKDERREDGSTHDEAERREDGNAHGADEHQEDGRDHHDKDEHHRTEAPMARMNIKRTDATNMTRMNIKRTETPMTRLNVERTDAPMTRMNVKRTDAPVRGASR